MTARPIDTQLPRHWCMYDLTNEGSFYSQATCVINVHGLLFYIVHVPLYSQVTEDVRSTGAGIKCLSYTDLKDWGASGIKQSNAFIAGT